MKKRIWITVGSILTVGTVATLATLIPAVQASVGSSIMVVNNQKFLSENSYINVTNKEALLGTKKINNGNYVFYVGSNGIGANAKFLYNIPLTDSAEGFIQTLNETKQEINGDFWNTINYVLNSADYKKDHVVPEFVSYIQTTNTIETTINLIYNQCQGILDDAWNHRFDENLTKEEQNEWSRKLNWVSQRLINGKIDTYNIPTTLDGFKTANSPGQANGAIKDPNDPKYPKSNPWKISKYTQLKIEYSPFKTYTNLDDKQVYFANDAASAEFRNFFNFIKARPEFSSVKDLEDSPGVIVAYKDGKLAKLFTASFGSTSSDSSSDSTTEQQSYVQKLKTTDQSNNINKPVKSDFYNWIDEVFANKKDGNTDTPDNNSESQPDGNTDTSKSTETTRHSK